MKTVTLQVPEEMVEHIKHLTGQLIVRSLTAVEKMKFDVEKMTELKSGRDIDIKTVKKFQENIRREQALALKYQLLKESL